MLTDRRRKRGRQREGEIKKWEKNRKRVHEQTQKGMKHVWLSVL